MIRTLNELQDYAIGATDGEVGHVKDFFFDDRAWVIRFLVVETGSWLSSRKVLISPFSIGKADWDNKRLPVQISREQVKNSPDVDTERPVTRQHEILNLDYYRYPYYWGGDSLWGDGLYYPIMASPAALGYDPLGNDLEVQRANGRAQAMSHQNDDPHLRSCKAVTGYHIHASDGDIGHIQGLLVDEDTWAIRYMVVNTSNWWVGQQVLVAPQWISEISWTDESVRVDLTRESVRNAPVFDTSTELNRHWESSFYSHYGRPGYWENEPAAARHCQP
jgi:hypothetical protein